MTLVHVIDGRVQLQGRKGADAADSQNDFLSNAHLAVAAIKRTGDLACGRAVHRKVRVQAGVLPTWARQTAATTFSPARSTVTVTWAPSYRSPTDRHVAPAVVRYSSCRQPSRFRYCLKYLLVKQVDADMARQDLKPTSSGRPKGHQGRRNDRKGSSIPYSVENTRQERPALTPSPRVSPPMNGQSDFSSSARTCLIRAT